MQAPPHSPIISVLIASYNYESYLAATLDSVLAQTFQDFEIIVVDDGSKDSSLTLAGAYAGKDSRVKVFCHEGKVNRGLPATLELALRMSRGGYVAFLEADDLWREDCLALRLKAVEDSGCEVVFNAVAPLVMPGASTKWFDMYVRRIMSGHSAKNSGKAGLDLRLAMLVENKIPTFSCAMLKRPLLESCDFSPPVRAWLDWWIWQQLSLRTRFAFVPEELTLWRLHPASYNHGKRVGSYLGDCRRMWRGSRELYSRQAPRRARMALAMPFWARLAARAALLLNWAGPFRTMSGVLSRLTKKTAGDLS